MRCAQTQQVKKLEAFHEQRVAESKKKIETDLKEASKRLYTKSVSKDERSRWIFCIACFFVMVIREERFGMPGNGDGLRLDMTVKG